MAGDLIAVGEVVAPHGVRGLLRVYPLTDEPLRFRDLAEVLIDNRSYRVLQATPHKNLVLLRLDGVDSRDQAEALRGKTVCIPREQVRPLAEGRYYDFELVGMCVYDEAGALIGRLKDVLRTPANAVYVIEADGREVLIPAVREFVREVDVEGRRMVVRPIPGMLD